MTISKKKIALYSLGIIVLGFTTVLGVVYLQFSDLEKFKKLAVERLEDLTGKKVSIGSAEMDFIKGLSVKLKGVTIGENYEEKPKFHAKSLWMVIKLLPLLDKRIEVKKIEVEGVFLQLIRDSKGGFDMERIQQMVSQPPEDGFLEVLKGSLINKLEIKGGEIRFIDLKTFAGEAKPAALQIKKVHVLIQKQFLKIPYDFLVQGEIPHPKRPAQINVSGTFDNPTMTWDLAGFTLYGQAKIQDLPVAGFQPYLKKVIPSVSDEGRVSLDSKFSGSLAGKLHSTGKLKFVSEQEISTPVLRDPSVPHRGLLDYEIILTKDTLRLTKIKMDSPSFNFTAKGGLAKYNSNDPKIWFAIKTGAFQINKSESYLPLKILPHEYHELVHQRLKNGTLAIESLKFKGALSQLQNLALKQNRKLISGKVRMRQVDWLDPLPLLQNVNGSLELESGNGVLKIEKARFQDHPITNVEGKVNDLVGQPVVDLSLDNKVEIGKFHQTLMAILAGHSFQDFVSIYRDMKGPGSVQVHLKGPLMDPSKLALKVGIFLEDVSLYQEGIGPRINHLNGRIECNLIPPDSEEGKKVPLLTFDNFSGSFGKSLFSKVFGKVTLENEVPIKEMRGTYTLNVDELPQVITDLALDYPFDILHENTSYTSGSVYVTYGSVGNPMVPGESKEWGEIHLQDLSVRYNEGFLPVSNLSGKITFEEEGPLHLVDVKGWYGDSPVQLEGDLTPYSEAGPVFDLVAKSSKFLPSSLKDVPFLEKLKYTGYLETELKFRGTLHDLEFDHTVDLSQAAYQYEDLFVKPGNAFNKIQIKGHFDSPKDEIVIKNLSYDLGVNKVKGRANIKSFDSPKFFVHFNSRNLKTNALASSLVALKNSRNGSADFQIHGQGSFSQLENSKFAGEVAIRNMEFLPEDHAHVITLNAGVKFSEKTVQIQDGNLAADKSDILFAGIYQWGDQPKMDLNVSGKRLVLEELLPAKSGGTDLKSTFDESALLSNGTSKVAFDLEELDYKLLTLKAVIGELSVEKKKIKISKLDVGKVNTIRGRGIFDMESSDALRFKGLIQADNIPAKEFFDLFGDTFENGMTGELKTLDIRVKGQGKGLKEIGKSLLVKSSFDFKSGQIDHERLKVGALKLFGFNEEGDEQNEDSLKDDFSPYEQIAGNFKLVNGMAETENFIYEDDKRRSSLVGTFDLNKYEMDTVLGVAPMAALDKFLTKIPLFGKILTGGDEESLVKTYFTLKGKFDKPELKSIPFTSLTKKVVGIFQGILQTPKFILNPSGEETN